MLAASAMLAACSKGKAGEEGRGGADKTAVPVTVAVAAIRSVPVELAGLIGSVEAFATVTVKAEVSGVLLKVHFAKGQDVKKGDLLFTIDARPFEAALEQAQANLARDTALAHNAQQDADRDKALLVKGIASRGDADKSQAAAEAQAASVRADNAAVDTAKLNLEHCFIRSPIDGRAGNLLVHEGNLVKITDMELVTINQIRPIEVFFSVTQNDLPHVKRYLAEGKLQVQAIIPQEEDRPENGEVTFVDNAIDKSTGQVRLAAKFDNAQERLWPGQSVNVLLRLAVQKNALVVPARAVQTGRDGKYVFLVRPDKTAHIQPVLVRMARDEDIVIDKGLAVGDRVVTDGQLRLTEGATVELQAPASKPASRAFSATSSQDSAATQPEAVK